MVLPGFCTSAQVNELADALSLRSPKKVFVLESAVLVEASHRAKATKQHLDWNLRFRDLRGFAPKSTICDATRRVPKGDVSGVWDVLVNDALEMLLHEQSHHIRRLR